MKIGSNNYFDSNSYGDGNILKLWTLLFLGLCGMFSLSSIWQFIERYEAWLWTCFSLVVLCPVIYLMLKLAMLQRVRWSVPLMSLGIFFCVCFDPLKYYWTGGRIRSPIGFPAPSHEAFSDVGFLVSLFCLMTVLVIAIPTRKNASSSTFIQGPQTITQIQIGAVLLFIVGLAPFILLGGEGYSFSNIINALLRGRSESTFQFETTSLASSTAHILVLGNAMVVSGLLAGYGLIAFSGKFTTKAFLFLLFLISLAFVASGGGRTRVGFVLFPLIILICLKAISNRQKKYVWIGCCFVVLTVSIFVIQLRYRDRGWCQIGQGYNQSGYSNDLCAELIFTVSYFPENEEFLGGDGILERIIYPLPRLVYLFITNPMPRILWAGKPESPSWAEYNYLRTGNSAIDGGSNITPTVIGRFYMEYGIPGVIQVGLLMGCLWRLVDKAIITHKWGSFAVIVACMFSYYLLQSTRDLWPGWLYPILFLTLYGFAIDIYNRKYARHSLYYAYKASEKGRSLYSNQPFYEHAGRNNSQTKCTSSI